MDSDGGGGELEPEPEPVAPAEVREHLMTVVRRYEQIKLALMVLVVVIDIAIGVYLIGLAASSKRIARDNQSALVILRCAVSRETSFDSHGKLRTQAEQRVAFEACIAAGGPAKP